MASEAVISQYGKSRYSVRTGKWKLIESASPPKIELFDLDNDPRESNNIANGERRRVAELRAVLRDWMKQQEPFGGAPGARPVLSDEEIERLRALGYIDSGAPAEL